MHTENDVIACVVKELRRTGYRIDSALDTSQRGIDIEAEHPKLGRLLVEAKGETTSKLTARRGRPFNRSQCNTHLAVALLSVARLREKLGPGDLTRLAIALPAVEPHLELVGAVRRSLSELEIGVFWVTPSGAVSFEAPWRA